ncbi:MAG: S1C family serine protease [Patescibacteria group bacterium]|nr:S1C family serine protease [Patescibacteria group bacterium]
MSKLKNLIKHPVFRSVGIVVGLVLLSAVSGGLAGSWMAARTLPNRVENNYIVPTSTVANSQTQTATSTSIKLVAMQTQDSSERAVPESILNRRSPVGLVYARKKGFAADALLSDQDLQGRVVAVTSDGWFVTVPQTVQGWRTSEMLVWFDGQAYKIEKAILDKSTQSVFIKTNAKNLPATPFANFWSTRTGLASWFEPSPNEYSPTSIEALRTGMVNDPVSSDRALRRLVVLGTAHQGEWGSPVWDPKGALVGIVETSAEGRLTLVPGSNLAASLQSLVGNGQISHALLGVYSLDKYLIKPVSTAADSPSRGAWVTGRGVVKESAAEKAGIKLNDVILQVDRDIMDGSSDLSDILLQYRPGSSVTLRIWRAGKEMDVPVTLGTQVTSEVIP